MSTEFAEALESIDDEVTENENADASDSELKSESESELDLSSASLPLSSIVEFPIKEAYTSQEQQAFADVLGYSSIGTMINNFIKKTDALDEPFSFALIAKAANEKKIEQHHETLRERVVDQKLEPFHYIICSQFTRKTDVYANELDKDVEALGNFNVEGYYPFEDAVADSDVKDAICKAKQKFSHDTSIASEKLANAICKAIGKHVKGKKVTSSRNRPVKTDLPTSVVISDDTDHYELSDDERKSWRKILETVVYQLWIKNSEETQSKLMSIHNQGNRYYLMFTSEIPEELKKRYTSIGNCDDENGNRRDVSLYINMNATAIKNTIEALCSAIDVQVRIKH